MDRRNFIKNAAGGIAAATAGLILPPSARATATVLTANDLPSGIAGPATLASLPGKKPLIKRAYRALNYETPTEYLNEMFTPNNAFFVRYHLANVPTDIKADTWRLQIGGDAAHKPYELNLDRLKHDFEAVEFAAVCQCSGNRRGLCQPHVAGVEWGNGAIGNARWKGARLRDVLNKAGISKDALEVALNGADRGVLDATPDFQKSLPMWKALDENTIIAYEMNGEPLPYWNGFPARLIVPGWTATYWMKHLTTLTIQSQPFKGFWMNPAYRIPTGKFPITNRFLSQENATSTPITEMVVNSLITNLKTGQRFHPGQPVAVKGIAWDAGYGMSTVEVSTDGGRSWREAELGKDHGRYSWRQWSYVFKPGKKGRYAVMARATNSQGASQTLEWVANPAGYHNNVIQTVDISVA